MSVSSEYSITSSEEFEASISENKAVYGFTDNDLAPFTVAGLRKEAKKKGLTNDEIKKVIKQRRRVKVRKYSKNFRAREQQQMADMEVEIRVLNLRKQRLIDERVRLINENEKYKHLCKDNPILIFQQGQSPYILSPFITPKAEPNDSPVIKRSPSMGSSPCCSFYPSPIQTENYPY